MTFKKKQNLTFISKSIFVLHVSSNSRNSFPIKCQTCHARLWKLLWGHQSRKLVVDLITLQHYEVLIILKIQACFFLYSIYQGKLLRGIVNWSGAAWSVDYSRVRNRRSLWKIWQKEYLNVAPQNVQTYVVKLKSFKSLIRP